MALQFEGFEAISLQPESMTPAGLLVHESFIDHLMQVEQWLSSYSF